MGKRLNCRLAVALTLLLPVIATAQSVLTEKHYRQAAWAFYLQQPEQALETLQLAPDSDQRTGLLEAGLYLQLNMPQHAAVLLQQLLLQQNSHTNDSRLPQSLRNIALLQFARYQLEQGDKSAARQYLTQVKLNADDKYRGQQQLLQQLIAWPDITVPSQPAFAELGDQPEMPYIVSNQVLALSARQQTEQALNWLEQLQQKLVPAAPSGFWQQLFSGQWLFQPDAGSAIYKSSEKQALADYLQLTEAKLHMQQQDWAAADAILANFSANSVLSDSALQLYSQVLAEQRHIPQLLSVLQQQIKQQPFTLTAWQAATRLGEQLEQSLQKSDALAAYRWAEQYYTQQQQLIREQSQPLQVQQLLDNLTPWQQHQITSHSELYRLQQDILSLQQQLSAAPQRQQRLMRLQQVIDYKLSQQQQLLSGQLPLLRNKQNELTAQFAVLQQRISQQQTLPLSAILAEGDSHQQLKQLQRAQQRLDVLQRHNHPQAEKQAQRLQRLEGILQWDYSYNSAERNWQLTKQQNTLAEQLATVQRVLSTLEKQGGKTQLLQQQQQQVAQMSMTQQQVNLALLSKQQQLLAVLNQQLQHLREQQYAQLIQLQRHNKEAMARVMEQLLLNPVSAQTLPQSGSSVSTAVSSKVTEASL